MASGMEWRGMDELQKELRALPESCRSEAEKHLEDHVHAAFVTIKRVYDAHRFTGTLSARLSISPMRSVGVMSAGLVLRSGSPLAWLFDNGSQARHYVTEKGKTHLTGRMPANHVFSRTVGFTRRKLLTELKEMLLRKGAAAVTDDGQ